MPDSLRTAVAQFSSSGGHVQPRAANVRAVEPAPGLPGAERGNLYMLVEVTGGGHAALYRQILNSVQTSFYEATGPQQSALTRAIRGAHSVLSRANEGLPEAGWRAGISLVAFHEGKLSIAQAGPALVLVGHPQTIEQFPGDINLWTAPIGGPERPDIKLFETEIEPGSLVILAQASWLEQTTPRALATASAADSVTVAVEYLAQIAGAGEVSALLVAIEPAAAASKAAPEVATTAAVAAVATKAVLEESSEAAAPPKRGLFGRRQPPPEAMPEEQEPVVAQPRVDARPSREPAGRAVEFEAEEEAPRRSPWALILALVIIPLLIAALVAGMWYLRAKATETEFLQSLDGANTVLTEVASLSEEIAGRQRLVAARDLLDKAKALRRQDARMKQLEERYQEQFTRLHHLTNIYGIVPLHTFTGEDRNLTRVLVSADSLYVLDRGLNEVYRFTFPTQLRDTVKPVEGAIIKKGDTLKDKIVSDLVDMTWVKGSGNQHSRLLVLDSANNLFSYDEQWGADAVPLATNSQMLQPYLTQGFTGKLYIVDAKAKQIWRYPPGQNGYENPAEPYFPAGNEVDMTGIQDMAIDGSVWLLFADGRLPRFLSGDQEAFLLQGEPDRMSAPVSLSVSETGDLFYVADAANERILEFNKNGEFQRQFADREGKALEEMRSIYLDELDGSLLVLTSNQLYKAPLQKLDPAEAPAP